MRRSAEAAGQGVGLHDRENTCRVWALQGVNPSAGKSIFASYPAAEPNVIYPSLMGKYIPQRAHEASA